MSAATVIYSLGDYMSRVAIVATIATTIATCILAFLSPSLAAGDAEIGSLGDKMSGAFRCTTYASLFHDQKEQQRLFQIGLKAGRDYVEGLKSRDDPKSETLTFMRGVSTDFVVGQMYEAQSTHAYDELPAWQSAASVDSPQRPLREWSWAPFVICIPGPTLFDVRFRR